MWKQFHRNITSIVQSRLEEAAERGRTRHRVLRGRHGIQPRVSEILQQIQDPLLLALSKLLVLPVPDVLRVLCRGENTDNRH